MKWGDRNESGCKDAECDKVHPLVCDKSLELKCFDKDCAYKLHILKCKRVNTSVRKPVHDAGPGAQPQQRAGRDPPRHAPVIQPWQKNNSSSNQQVSSTEVINPSQNFQKMTVQPQLEAYMKVVRQELFQELMFLRSFLARELQFAHQEGFRPFC